MGDGSEEADPPDDALMARAKAGDDAAFNTLVRRHYNRLGRVAAKYLIRSDLATDAVHNTFVELHRAVPRYEPRGRLTSYLYRVLLNQCRMLQRRSRYDKQLRERLAVEPPPNAGAELQPYVLAPERQRELDDAVASLSDKLKAVVHLRFSAGLTYEEIAQALELPLGTVQSRLFLALKKLRKQLQWE